jgi:hypothetical protein
MEVEMDETELQNAVNVYNQYVDLLNTMENNIKYNLKLAKEKISLAYEALNKNIESDTKKQKIKQLEILEEDIINEIRIIERNIIPQINSNMQYLKNQYNLC